ncbi:MAG: cytochrome d ubiquinol oxidase subunit II [Fibrobacteria bacterium]|nr:cytochrome d ubiquinol oxidase subunit II [Fibrobacteria bacterium]
MDLNITWFILVCTLLVIYAVLDGFDLGAGILSLFVKKDTDKKSIMTAIGPVWDGNEVWLLTAGGALFAAFPKVYATVFSGFYLAMMLLLAALIFRGVSLEFRNQVDSPGWKALWDRAFGFGSLVIALLIGTAFGNLISGVPINANGDYTGSFLELLDPYSLLVGVIAVVLFSMHGSIYIALKTSGELHENMKRKTLILWSVLIILYVVFVIASSFTISSHFSNAGSYVCFFILVATLIYIPLTLKKNGLLLSFAASSLVIVCMIGKAAIETFPALAISNTNINYSLTIYNSASTPKTQGAMLIIAGIGLPIVISYTIWVYRIFKGKVGTDGGY